MCFIQKGFAQKAASELGVAIVAPDTSPRGADIEGEDDGWDFGTGKKFHCQFVIVVLTARKHLFV
jgi:S-formylglutathione hydrolase